MIKLTPRERQILVKLAVGKTNAEIAQEMKLAEQTVKNYMSDLLAKLDCKNRVQLAVKAVFGAIPLEQTMELFLEYWESQEK